MNWTIPGTVLEAPRAECDQIPQQFGALFLGGGIALSQVAAMTGLEPYAIQNWVKRGFLSSPQNRRYNLEQLCRIITINMLKGALTLEQICNLLGYINGNLADDSDDIIDDAILYFMFVKLAARARHIGGNQDWDQALAEAVADYEEPYPGAKARVIEVLRVMLMAWISSRFQAQVSDMVAKLQ